MEKLLVNHVISTQFSDVLPFITKITDLSISGAIMPSRLKTASLSPLLKKAMLDSDEYSSYRPILT